MVVVAGHSLEYAAEIPGAVWSGGGFSAYNETITHNGERGLNHSRGGRGTGGRPFPVQGTEWKKERSRGLLFR